MKLAQKKVAKVARPALYVESISMADGSDINSPEAQLRIARAGLALARINAQASAQPLPTAAD